MPHRKRPKNKQVVEALPVKQPWEMPPLLHKFITGLICVSVVCGIVLLWMGPHHWLKAHGHAQAASAWLFGPLVLIGILAIGAMIEDCM